MMVEFVEAKFVGDLQEKVNKRLRELYADGYKILDVCYSCLGYTVKINGTDIVKERHVCMIKYDVKL